MRIYALGISICIELIAATAVGLSAHAQGADSPDDLFKIYAVHIDRTPKQSWIGQGVYLGRGFVITAAHVAGLWFWRWPRVEIGGKIYPTKVIKDGHFYNVDLTLLSVDEQQIPVSLGLRRMPLCKNPPLANAPVIIATPESTARSYVLSHSLLPTGITPKNQTAIHYTAESGNSGSGVFDVGKRCLMGIITAKISKPEVTHEFGHPVTELRDFAKSLVPATTIAEFLPADARF